MDLVATLGDFQEKTDDEKQTKGFLWEISDITKNGMFFNFTFDEPNKISFDSSKPDAVVMTFTSSDKYLNPVDTSKEAMLDGYKFTVRLPSQMSPGLESTQESA